MTKSQKEFSQMVAKRYRHLEQTAMRMRLMELLERGELKLEDHEEAQEDPQEVQEGGDQD